MELHLTATKCHLSYGDHTVLPATWHKWTHPALNPARQAGTRFTHPGGMEGWVDLGDLLHTKMVYPARRRSPTHCKYYPGPNSINYFDQCQRANHYTTPRYRYRPRLPHCRRYIGNSGRTQLFSVHNLIRDRPCILHRSTPSGVARIWCEEGHKTKIK